jgi:S1-C subfamily serine protease
MPKTPLLVLAGFVAGLGISCWLQSSSPPFVEAATSPPATPSRSGARDAVGVSGSRGSGGDALPFIDRARRADAATLREQRLAVDLIVAGFAPDRAAWIDGRVQELRLQAKQAQDEARRAGRPPPADAEAVTLRAELGDQDFERFLMARGVPTGVIVSSVPARSPAERAGMQPGDEIFFYDGKRVFNARELNELAARDALGEPVVADVRRDGQNLRVVLPRGPLGVAGGDDPRAAAPAVVR